MSYTTTSGPDLARQRIAAGVKIATLARAVGVSRPTIYSWEADPALGEIPTRRYLEALHRLVNEYPAVRA
jgi:DNA-binding XRE family transcriptional regulator